MVIYKRRSDPDFFNSGLTREERQSHNLATTNNIKNYLKDNVYKHESGDSFNANNPYINLINDFDKIKGLKIKASDLAYLRELGVYPINRMAILRRFPEGAFVSEQIDEMQFEPISTIIGWIKPEENFGSISFNETWNVVNQRFDQVLAEIIQKATGGVVDISTPFPIPDFAQGWLFEMYKRMGLTDRGNVNQGVDEGYEYYDAKSGDVKFDERYNKWGLNNIPVGDPNVLQQGPYRDPESQNIESSFSFNLETTYEQKLIGDVDPGSAMLDILDNMYAMGTSNMAFYWGDSSPRIQKLQSDVLSGKANNLYAWWDFIKNMTIDFWKTLIDFFTEKINNLADNINDISDKKTSQEQKDKSKNEIIDSLANMVNSILTSTIAIHRFKLRGSIELMVGGKMSSTPWYLTLGNPYSPWLATNHIIVKTASVETSPDMGFNDQPQWLKVTFNCAFSRALGKQELMRMFNNTFRRAYSLPI